MQVFVTTYAVGNEKGFAVGKWFDLADYADKDDFIAAASEYAKSELGDTDPELCFPDFEGIPKDLVDEVYIPKELFGLDESDSALLLAYREASGELDLYKAHETYCGSADSDEEFVQTLLDDCGDLDGLPDWVLCHIDWSGVARDVMTDYCTADGYYFRTY